jgi:acetyl-CoA acetyltransferase
MSTSYDGVVLTAPVSFGYERYSEHGVPWFAGNALAEMLRVSGLDKAAIDGLAIASFSLPPDTPPSLAEYFGLELRLLEALPFGGASGVIAARRAARAIQARDAEVVACIGADTSSPEGFGDLVANFSTATIDSSFPYAAGGPNLPFALMTRAYMDRYGVEREDFGRLCVSQRYNANHCDYALLGHKKLTLEDYLAANLSWLSARDQSAWQGPGVELASGVELHSSILGAGARVTGSGVLHECVVWPGARAEAPARRAVFTAEQGKVQI